MYSVPLERSVDYGMNVNKGYKTIWAVLFSSGEQGKAEIHHADVFQGLASVNRMATITEKSTAVALKRAEEELRRPNPERAFNLIDREFARITTRLYLLNLFEKAYMLEVQVTIFAISRCLLPRDTPPLMRVDGQMLASIVLSFMTLAKTIFDSWFQWKRIADFTKREVPGLEDPEVIEAVKRSKRRLEKSGFCYLFAFVLMCIALLHAAMKFAMAFYCEDSLWNLNWYPPSGCVRLESIFAHQPQHDGQHDTLALSQEGGQDPWGTWPFRKMP
eukprot:UN0185